MTIPLIAHIPLLFRRYTEAETLYDDLLEAHPNCSAVWKRKVAVLKAQGKASDAIDELNQFLEV